ncbi:MAG: cytochrome C oxidase subunit IV family protein [Planctomycetes bacterium]|nr:cytochrome C oxidase subunit IV family protein [Planctomycetota bacterium]
MAGHDRKTYIKIFLTLTILTAIEVAIPFIDRKYGGKFGAREAGLFLTFTPRWSSSMLFMLSIVKAGLVGLYFMHLKYETKWLKFIAMLPAIAGFYAVMMCGEAFYRFFYANWNMLDPVSQELLDKFVAAR